MTEQHFDRDEEDEDGSLVGGALPVAVLKRVRQVVLGWTEVVVEHVLAADVELVRHLLGLRVPERTLEVNLDPKGNELLIELLSRVGVRPLRSLLELQHFRRINSQLPEQTP